MILKILAGLGLASLALAAIQIRAEEKRPAEKDSQPRLSGRYAIVSGEKFGQPEPEGRIAGTLVRFGEDTVTVTDKDKQETYVATYKVDTSRRPHLITMTSTRAPNKGEVARGLIETQGDNLRLIYALPGGPMPTEFKTSAKQLLFVMKRLSD